VGDARRYRWLTPAECVAAGLSEQVAQLVQDQNRVRGRTITPGYWAAHLAALVRSGRCGHNAAAAYREAVRVMQLAATGDRTTALRDWCRSHPHLPYEADDSRESIYPDP